MFGTGQTTKERIISAAYGAFYRDGFARVGVDRIAEDAGVTKKTLYYHFESKDALLAEVLEQQHRLALERISRWASPGADSAAALVQGLFAELGDWAGRGTWQGSGFTRAAAELAGMPGHPGRHAAKVHKAAIEEWLNGRLSQLGVADPEPLGRELVILLEGCQTLALVHGDAAYVEAAAHAALCLVAAHESRDQSLEGR